MSGKLAPVVAATILFAAALCPAGGKPIPIRNAGFESGSGDTVPGWGWWSRTGKGSAKRIAGGAHSGKGCVEITYDAERDWNYSSEQEIPVKPGDVFRVGAWVKIEKGEVYIAAVARAGGKTLDWDIGSGRTDKKGTWVHIEGMVEVPDRCDRIYVRFGGREDTRLRVDDVTLETAAIPGEAEKPKVKGYAEKRVTEKLGRGLVAVPAGKGAVHLSWRLLPGDPPDAGFDVRREAGGNTVTLNESPIVTTTDFTDEHPPAGKKCRYDVCRSCGETGRSRSVSVTPGKEARPWVEIAIDGDQTFQKIGIADLDGDGAYDYVIKQPNANIDPWHKYWKKSPDTYTLAAYAGGKLLWRYDMGWAIERGIWYSPCVVYDFDGDGKAEVAVKSGEGDPRDEEGKVRSGPEYLTILDGMTGTPAARADWPSRELFAKQSRGYNYASRNQLGVAYLDGRTPCLIVERGTYNVIIVDAWEFHDGTLRKLWRWDNRRMRRKYWGQGAHWMHGADVDGDGRDEVVIGSAVIDDDGSCLWSTGLGHPDHCYVGDLDPRRPGLEIYYGIESRRKKRNGMCMVDAKTGEILWGYAGFTRHVHSCGMCSDIDAGHPGAECYSADTDARKKAAWARLWSSGGTVLSKELRWNFGPRTAWWDADVQRELLWGRRVKDYGGGEHCRLEGRWVLTADVLGDWREEIVMTLPGRMRIYTTPIPARDRRPCLMTDPLYRLDVAHAAMGYTQVPMPGYDLASKAGAQ